MGNQIYPELSPDLMLSIARERLARQLSFLDSLDTKLAALLTGGSTLLGLLAAVLALRPAEAGVGGWVALAFASLAFAVLAHNAITHLDPRRWAIGTDVDLLWGDHFHQDEHLLRWETAMDYLLYYEENEPKYSAKVDAVRRASKALVIETAALLAGLAFVAVAG